jgi:P4 family phage/plasmid primase-like protien
MTSKKPISSLLSPYFVKKGDQKEITNTRIGNANLHISGGSYHIPADKYPEFLSKYAVNVFKHGEEEYLTEKQLAENGPILIDLDLRHTYETDERQYTEFNVMDLVGDILAGLKSLYLFDSNACFPMFVFEKDTVNRQEESQITKDGLHIIVGIQSTSAIRLKLRELLIASVSNSWSDIPLVNTWEDVFDQGVMNGPTNWQLVGSKKPANQAYKLTQVYDITYDGSEFEQTKLDMDEFDLVKNVYRLSARYPNHPAFPLNPTVNISGGGGGGAGGAVVATNAKVSSSVSSSITRGISSRSGSMYNIAIQSVRTNEELAEFMTRFLSYIQEIDVNNALKDVYGYLMTLPAKYYGRGSYDQWMRVGWALKNTNDCLFPYWVEFSSQSDDFQFSNIIDMYDKWDGFNLNKSNGLTSRSILYWSKFDAPEKYNEVRKKSIDFMLELCIQKNKYDLDESVKTGGCTSVDLAELLYHLYKDRFVCCSIRGNIWYEYKDHRWKQIDSGAVLRHLISTEMRRLFDKKREAVWLAAEAAEEGPKKDLLTKQQEKYGVIVTRLGNTTEKNNIMTESRELFRDETFMEKIDNNNNLLCFKNGVFEFNEKVFRKGYPEDYITLCTNIDYIPFEPTRDEPIRKEIHTFFSQLFPDKELRRYMMEHLSSTYIGGNPNQTMNMYTGYGQNGKSVLTQFMILVLGEYKGDAPMSLISTNQRTKIGGLAPELLALKGKRYVIIQEPAKDEVIHDGIMKQLTSGEDIIQARAPYQPNAISYLPAFKLIVCSNELMEVKGNSHGTWRRFRVVPFEALFTENPRNDDPTNPYQFKVDTNIKIKFEQWKEVFACMMVEIACETMGITRDCDKVLIASREYRESQDQFSQFIAEKVMKDPQGKLKKSEVNQEFSLWYSQNNGGRAPSNRDLHDTLDKMFGKNKTGTWTGVRIRYGDMAEVDAWGSQENVIDENDVYGQF